METCGLQHIQQRNFKKDTVKYKKGCKIILNKIENKS